MKKSCIQWMWLALLSCLMCLPLSAAEICKIACVGDSITFGAGIPNREKSSYPAQLQEYLGEQYKVENFGVSGATLLRQGDKPYEKTHAYRPSLAYQPDILFIKLGTNDSKATNMSHIADFKADYLHLIKSYQQNNPKLRIILLTPIRAYTGGDKINDERIRQSIVPIIEEIASENNIELIDLYPLFAEKCNAALIPDKIHPSSLGAGMIARVLEQYLRLPAPKDHVVQTPASIEKQLKTQGLSINYCAKAVPRMEFRNWGVSQTNFDWCAIADEIAQVLGRKQVDLLLLGDSITQRFATPDRTLIRNRMDFTQQFQDISYESAGISGDRTQHLLWRLEKGHYNNCKPAYVSIAIGVNNLLSGGNNAQDTYEGIIAVTHAALKEFPQAKILLFGLLPCSASTRAQENYQIIQANLKQATFDPRVTYIDPTLYFADKNGKVKEDLYMDDKVHLKDAGYKVWIKLIKDSMSPEIK